MEFFVQSLLARPNTGLKSFMIGTLWRKTNFVEKIFPDCCVKKVNSSTISRNASIKKKTDKTLSNVKMNILKHCFILNTYFLSKPEEKQSLIRAVLFYKWEEIYVLLRYLFRRLDR